MRSVRYRFRPPKTRSVRHYFPISVFSVFLLRNLVVRIRYTGLKCHQIFFNSQGDRVYTVCIKMVQFTEVYTEPDFQVGHGSMYF